MKKIIAGLLIGIIISVSIPSLAESIDVLFNKIKVTINGAPVNADNVLINGRTYVPLRAIAEMIGKDVKFNQETSTAEINDKDYNPNQNKKVGYSRNNAADLKTTVKCDFNDGYDKNMNPLVYSANITVKEVLRGDFAVDKIKDANRALYREPQQGHDYLLAKIEFELLTGENQFDLYSSKFKLISQDGKEYSSIMVINPEPSLTTKLYKGAKHEGYAVFDVETKDSKPILTFGRDYEGNGGIWLKAY